MPVTIKDIASYAKVSTATVSLALQGKTVIAEATRGRIQRLAAELGYTPSGIGRALQSGRSGLIGYLLSSVASSYFNEVLQGVGVEAARRGYGLLTAITDGSELNVARQLKVFREKRVDGLLVSSADAASLSAALDFEKAGVPVAFCSLESPLPGIPFCVTDDFLGGELAGRHLVSRGAKRVAYFSLEEADVKRFQGCLSALAEMKLPALRNIVGRAALESVLREGVGSRPDAFFCYSDDAAALVKDVASELGLAVPVDLMIVGFDDSSVAALPSYRLTSLAPQKREIGSASVALLLDRIGGGLVESVRLPPGLVERASSGA